MDIVALLEDLVKGLLDAENKFFDNRALCLTIGLYVLLENWR